MNGHYVLTGVLRLLTLRLCRESFCNERFRCWRWHVETFDCPTCKRTVSEYDPHFGAVIEARIKGKPVLIGGPPKTWASGEVWRLDKTYR